MPNSCGKYIKKIFFEKRGYKQKKVIGCLGMLFLSALSLDNIKHKKRKF
jgi:hypothetical protein